MIVRWSIGVLLVAELSGAQTLQELEAAVRLNVSDAEAHGRLGIALRKAGRLPDAASSLSRAIELRPDPRLKVLLALTYIELGQCPSALPLLRQSLAAEQKDSIKLVIGQRLVECHLTTGRADEALPHVQALRQIAPHDANVLYLSSKVYMSLWNDAFQTLVTKVPDSYHVRLIQAEALEAQQRFDEAVHEYRAVLNLAPQLSEIRYRLGRALRLSQPDGKSDAEALAAFRQELGINPSHAASLIEIGDIHLRNGRHEEASQRFADAVNMQPTAVPARVGLAKVLIAEKRWAKALEQLEAAATIAPQDESIHYNLMLAYRGLGRTAEAKQAFDIFERLKQQRQK